MNGMGGGLIWGNGTGNGKDNGEGGPAGTTSGSEWRTGQGRRERGDRKKLGTVGRKCATLPGGLRGEGAD